MYRKKKISIGSEQTQPDNSKRFVRQSSYCSFQCKSSSVKKLQMNKLPLENSLKNPDIFSGSSTKFQTESQKFFKSQDQPFQTVVRRCSGSMKLQICKLKDQCQNQDRHNIQQVMKCETKEEVQALKSQCRKLKVYFNEQREKRKVLEEEVRFNKVEIRRLEKRLQKYINEKSLMIKQRQTMLEHIQILENKTFNQENKLMHSYKMKFLQEEILRLREELLKSKSLRQTELLKQVEKLIEQKYVISNDLKAAIVAKQTSLRQMDQLNEQLQELRVVAYQKVVRSVEYIELRERYRMVLIECKQLKEEIEHMQQLKQMDSQNSIEQTLLTVSISNQSISRIE